MDQAGTSGEESAGLPLAEPMTECSSSSEGECTENETGSNVKRSLTLNNGNAMMGSDSPPPWFSTFVDKFESRFTRLEQRMESLLVERLDEISLKVTENEEKITACSIQLDDVVSEVKRLKLEREDMLSKLDDLENRSRRNNLVFHGVPESQSPQREICQEVVEELIHKFVGLSSSEAPIERCHRTPTAPGKFSNAQDRDRKQNPRPRIIHVAFSSYVAKERVRKACIAKLKESTFKGHKIFVSEDFSKRVLQKRKNKLDHLKRLKEEGKRPFFLYPDRLAYRNKDGKLQIVA